MRTCIGCRGVRPRIELLRFVVGDREGLMSSRVAPGRGAWLCPAQSCWDHAVKRRAWTRALRRTPVLPASLSDIVDVNGFRDAACAD